jgi:hypothetical protein
LPIVQIRYSTYCCLVIMIPWYHLATPSESPAFVNYPSYELEKLPSPVYICG